MMTLTTRLWVTSPGVNTEELWIAGQQLIYRFSNRKGLVTSQDHPISSENHTRGTRHRAHDIDQGFCAVYRLIYHPRTGRLAHRAETDPYTEPNEQFDWYQSIYLDTSNGFTSQQHKMDSPGELHAAIIAGLGQFLTPLGASWCWQNEYTGQIFQGSAGLASLR